MEETGQAFAVALAAERVRNARAINFFRLVALTIGLAAMGLFWLTLPGWIGPPVVPFLLWWAAAVAVLVASWRTQQPRRLTALAIATIDTPLLFSVLAVTVRNVAAAGQLVDAHRLATHASIYFIGFVMLAVR